MSASKRGRAETVVQGRPIYKPIVATLVFVIGGYLFLGLLLIGAAMWPLPLDGSLASRTVLLASLVAFVGEVVCLAKGRLAAAIALLAIQCLAVASSHWL
jgi:hypothetical protein